LWAPPVYPACIRRSQSAVFRLSGTTFGMGTAKMSGTELTLNMDVRILSRSSLRAAERLTESVGMS
jgi:hypothetical protein